MHHCQPFWIKPAGKEELFQTKALNQAVRRNRDKFPEDFILTLTVSEAEEVRRIKEECYE